MHAGKGAGVGSAKGLFPQEQDELMGWSGFAVLGNRVFCGDMICC